MTQAPYAPPPASGPQSWPPPPPAAPPPAYPQGYGQPLYALPNEQNAVTAMVLGIIGIAACSLLGPFAWVMGKKSLDAIRAQPGRLGGEGMAMTGYVLGIISTCLLGLGLLFLVGYFLLIGAMFGMAAR